jgi:hypothetical protein
MTSVPMNLPQRHIERDAENDSGVFLFVRRVVLSSWFTTKSSFKAIGEIERQEIGVKVFGA